MNLTQPEYQPTQTISSNHLPGHPIFLPPKNKSNYQTHKKKGPGWISWMKGW